MIGRFLAAVLVFSALGCGANNSVLQSGKMTPNANSQPSKTAFESELDQVRDAKFNFIYVLRRKDGGEIDAEDRGVIRLQTVDMNRRVSADEGRAFIIGSNFQLPPANLIEIYKRFSLEDYSPSVTDGSPPATLGTNINAGT